jgi:hypothetical protein
VNPSIGRNTACGGRLSDDVQVQRESLAMAEELKLLHLRPRYTRECTAEDTPYLLGLIDQVD